MSFDAVTEFENEVASFYGAPYAIATDCCTHAIELCLRRQRPKRITVPTRTYISIPFTADKLGISWTWDYKEWTDYYTIGGTNIIDAAVLWKRDSYIPNSFMCLSFQFQKHLSLGRGGMILTDNKTAADTLKKMSYDGRVPNIPWRDQDIKTIGYHYYMTPEIAKLGLDKLEEAKSRTPRQWVWKDWPDLTEMSVFKFYNKS